MLKDRIWVVNKGEKLVIFIFFRCHVFYVLLCDVFMFESHFETLEFGAPSVNFKYGSQTQMQFQLN